MFMIYNDSYFLIDNDVSVILLYINILLMNTYVISKIIHKINIENRKNFKLIT